MKKTVTEWYCDRCHKKDTTEPDESYFTVLVLPIGWQYISKYLLCDDCWKAYENIMRRFMKRKEVEI